MTAPVFTRALVTGASGFLGSRLARHLVDAGVKTSILLRETSRTDALGDAATSVRVLRPDASTDAVRAAVAEARPEVVFHLAATYIAHHRPAEIDRLVADNVLLTARVCQGCVEAGCTALVHAGTAWQNARSAPGDETPAPNSLYAATKQAAQDVIAAFADGEGLNAATLKIYDSYGPGDPRRKFLNVLAEKATAGAAMEVSPGEQTLHIVHVDDLVAGFVHAGNLLARGEIPGHHAFTLPSPKAVSLRALAETWMHATGRSVDIRWGAQPYRPGEVMTPWEGTPLPGWTAKTSLADGLKAVYG